MAERRQPTDDELRRRLEDTAPLLESTRTRYLALVSALAAWNWRRRLRAVADVAREVSRQEEEVEQALTRAARRANAEAWPPGEVRALLEELISLRARFVALLEKRLGLSELPGPGLRTLLDQVVGTPRKVAMGDREAAAQEALETVEGLIPALHRFGAALEGLFGRPLTRGQRLPFTLAEYDAVLAAIPEGERALSQAWARVARIDTTGGVERELTRRAKRTTRSSRGLAGPRALAHADFWRRAALAHTQTLIDERFAPLMVLEAERTAALRFLLAREIDGAARLAQTGPRAALLMLAHELTASPEGRAPLKGGHGQVRAWAALADGLEGDDDWRRLRDGLRALAARSFRSALPPLYRVGKPVGRVALPERLTDFFSPPE